MYLIDGHNLIPKAGLDLRDAEDEKKLIRLLQEFARLKRKKVEVYFDGAPAGENGTRKYGTVVAYFVRQGRTADDAIRARLRNLGKAAKNYVVVSSDREVRVSARARHARILSSEEFAKTLRQMKTTRIEEEKSAPEKLSPQEIDEWMRFFDES